MFSVFYNENLYATQIENIHHYSIFSKDNMLSLNSLWDIHVISASPILW
jgi:L-rhamnose mutarotase